MASVADTILSMAGYFPFFIQIACSAFTEIGGDYYDYIPLTETTLGVAIGDVKGHGLPATIIQHVHHTASDIKKSILTEFFAHCQQHEQEDDVTLIVIKRKK